MEHKFKIAIGDWSGDGHGHDSHFEFSANKPIDVVRDAYFAAQKRFPELDPATFCNDYQDGDVPSDIWSRLVEMGCPMPESKDYGPVPEDFARIVAWYCMRGDGDLRIEMVEDEYVPVLQFYGSDKNGRRIGFFGYGLFS